MPPSVPDIEPTVFAAGDTVKWTKHLTDYPSTDGWSLSYAFRGEKGDGRLDITATGSGEEYSINVPGASTSLMNAGIWRWDSYATQGTERYRIASGSTRVEPNLAVTNFKTDLRSPAKRAYDNAIAAWEAVKLGKTVMLNGRQYTQHDLEQLIAYVDRCKSDWALEQQYADINVGGDPRKIYVRFNRDR